MYVVKRMNHHGGHLQQEENAQNHFLETMNSLSLEELDSMDAYNTIEVQFTNIANDCYTIDDIIEKLSRQIAWYSSLKAQGWELAYPIQQGYGILACGRVESPCDADSVIVVNDGVNDGVNDEVCIWVTNLYIING
jgi:hypothetical protein